jgi:hypothetical protein
MMIAAAVVLLGGWVSTASAGGCPVTVAAGASGSCTTSVVDLPIGTWAVYSAGSYHGLTNTPATMRLYVGGVVKVTANFNGPYDGQWFQQAIGTKKAYVTISTDNRNGSTSRTLYADLRDVRVGTK